MTDSLFDAVMSEASVNDDERYFRHKMLVFDTPTSALMEAEPLSLPFEMMTDVWEAMTTGRSGYKFRPSDYGTWKVAKSQTDTVRADLVGLLGLRLISTHFRGKYQSFVMPHSKWSTHLALHKLVGAETTMITDLLRSKLPLTEMHLLALIQSCRLIENMEPVPLASTTKAIDRYLADNPMSALLHDALIAFKADAIEQPVFGGSKELRQTVDQLDTIVTEHT